MIKKIISFETTISFLQKNLDDAQNNPLKILEAGCGSITKLKFSEKHFITGIDISQKQLDRNKSIQEKILGDIQLYQFPPSSFDMIVCWHVLEHLDKPEKAIINFIHSLRNGGRIVIASPNPFSLKGLVTKFTPHSFHVFIYRHVYGRNDAGKDDKAPFKSYMRFSIAPQYISKLAKSYGIETEIIGTNDAFNSWVGDSFRERWRFLFVFILALIKTLKFISVGKIGDSEFIIVLRKR